MSDIARWAAFDGGIAPHPYGKWILCDDHQAEVERLIAERDEIHAEVQRLTQILNGRRATAERVTAERDEALAEVERLKEQVGALTLAVEQADEMKANAEAAVLVEEAETDRVLAERNAAQVEVYRLENAIDNLTSERDEARAEVERLKEERDDYRAEFERTVVERDDHRFGEEQRTAERDKAQAEVERLKRMLPPTAHTGLRNGPGEGSWSVFAGTVVEERDEAREEVERLNAEVKRLTTERDEAQADVEQLTQNLVAWKKDYQELEQERNRAWDLGEELNRELEGQKAANQRLLRECAEDIASAKAREEAATTELNETREKLEEVQVQYDEFAKATAKVIAQHQRERDHARQQVYRLQQAGADSPSDQSAQNLDMANGQAILDSSRPDDETIWREAFMSQLHDRYWAASEVADVALAEYRKRWPR